jgi:N,N'-diacetyllegionaminate synthase
MKSLTGVIADDVFIVAEIGCNHNGSVDIAKELIDVAKASGANAAKFQSFVPEEMITKTSPKADYQIKATGQKESQFDRLKRMKLTADDHIILKQYCEDQGILFCSSPFDCKSASLLNDLDVPFFKIPSGEITNIPLLNRISSFDKPVILSTGMSNLTDIEIALKALYSVNNIDIVLLHCLSDYPSKWEEANLNAITTLKNRFQLQVGFSDHSDGYLLPFAAVSLGAVVIEKHITLSKGMEGGDHKASIEPMEFKAMVSKIRLLKKALGDGVKRCMPSEENTRDIARKSVVAKRKITKGAIISKEDLVIKRPGTGIQPIDIDKVIGKKAISDISADGIVMWSQLSN